MTVLNLAFSQMKKVIKKSFFRNFSWEVFSMLGTKLLTLSANIFIARSFGDILFGEWSIALGVIMVVIQLSVPNLISTVVAKVAETYSKNPTYCSEVLGFLFSFVSIIGIFATIISYNCAGLIAQKLYNRPEIAPLFKLLSISIIFLLLRFFLKAVLMGTENFKHSTFVEISSWFSFLLFLLIFTFCGVDYYCVIACSFLLAQLVAVALGIVFVRIVMLKNSLSLRFRKFYSKLGLIWSYSLPGLMDSATRGPVEVYTKAQIVKLDGGMSAIAGVQVASNWYSFVSFIPTIICRVSTPVLCRLKSEKNVLALQRRIFINILLAILFSSLFSLFIAFFGKYILQIYGDDFIKYNGLLKLFLIVAVLESIDNSIQSVFVTFSLMWIQAFRSLSLSLLFLVIAPYLIKLYGLNGFCYALMLIRLSATIITLICANYGLRKMKQDNF